MFDCVLNTPLIETYNVSAIELYKVLNGLSLDIMKDVFPLKASLNCSTTNKLVNVENPGNR